MLILKLKPDGKITIGDDIEIMLLSKDHSASLGITAPKDVEILREGVASEKTKNTLQTQPILLTRRDAMKSLQVCEKTLDSIPEALLPRCRFGKAVRFRPADLDALATRLAAGEIAIGPVNPRRKNPN